jgi:hypothetical protein
MENLAGTDAEVLKRGHEQANTDHQCQHHGRQKKGPKQLAKYVSMQGKNHCSPFASSSPMVRLSVRNS